MKNTLLYYASFCLLLFVGCEVPESANANQDLPKHPETANITAAVDQFINAISNQDTTAFRDVMLPEGAAIALFTREDGSQGYGWRMAEQDVAMLGSATEPMLERVWEPEIRVDGRLASVWTRYDFYQNEAFSHCGTDAFHLIKTEGAWKVASIIYTIEPDVASCPQSPLGAPTF